MIIYFSLLVSLIGLLIYVLVNGNPKLENIGLHMFWTGILAFMLSSHSLILGK